MQPTKRARPTRAPLWQEGWHFASVPHVPMWRRYGIPVEEGVIITPFQMC